MALPVTLEDAKRQLKLTDDDQFDAEEIEGFIQDAAGWVENYTGHILEARRVTEYFATFDRLTLRAWPVAAGSASVTIEEETDTPVSGVRVQAAPRPARLAAGAGTRWPEVPAGAHIRVEVTAGYLDPNEVPRNLVRAMLVLIAAYDADREGGEILQAAEDTARRLCRTFKRRTL